MSTEQTAAEQAGEVDERLAAFVRGEGVGGIAQVRSDVADVQHRLEVAIEIGGAEQAARRRAEDTLQDERVARAEAFRMHGAIVVERERMSRQLSEARTTVSRLELERTGAEQRIETAVAMRAELEENGAALLAERDRIRQAHGDAEQRIAAAFRALDDHPDAVEAADLAETVRAALRGETR